ncbi:uncharacterized protein LOC116417143 [Nasonia vitripennis]|uniref:CCHC-type domain-containing protein n=1 Tax=Nasonia vitripennis TaxID=7425 RepID=A0A7M7QAP2_NASVI|nr:uncharacterized protein LOC116417143 [Nasonia vitripennis]
MTAMLTSEDGWCAVSNYEADILKKEVLEALQKEIGEDNIIEDSTIRSLRKTYGNTQIAVRRVPAQIAAKITKLQKIKIGYVNCRIRVANRKNELLPCYKCLGFGHIGINCTVNKDRRIDIAIVCEQYKDLDKPSRYGQYW